MFDIGWTEMAVIVVLALIVIGPKDLPKAMQTVAHWVRKARGMAREFQSSLDEMVREAELDEAKKTIESTRTRNWQKEVEDTIDPTGDISRETQEIEKAARETGESSAPADEGRKSEAEAQDGADPQDATETASDEGEERAEIRRSPVQMAPGNSVKAPPDDLATAADAVPEADEDAPVREEEKAQPRRETRKAETSGAGGGSSSGGQEG